MAYSFIVGRLNRLFDSSELLWNRFDLQDFTASVICISTDAPFLP